jgi:hypothetical protein
MDWRSTLPIAGFGVLAVTGLYYFLKPKKDDPAAMERERRAYLNRVGRIVEGHVVEVVDAKSNPASARTADSGTQLRQTTAFEGVLAPAEKISLESRAQKHAAMVANRHGGVSASAISANGMPRLLFYSYSISGVTYETAQDITGLEEQLHLDGVAAGQTASVKYDPSNPSNSILLADDWSGLH